MTDIRRRLLASGVVLLALVGSWALAGSASAASGRTVSYRGDRVAVPAGWPVLRLGAHSQTCVRFDRHAVYLGAPGAVQRCPTHAAGRTEAILVAPLSSSGQHALASSARAVPAGGSAAQLVRRGRRVVVTATWHRHPAVVARALGVRSLAAAARSFDARRPAAGADVAHAGAVHPDAATANGVPGGVYTGLGFDACSTPSTAQMAAWAVSPFRAAGVYIGGTNMACSQANLTASWVSAQSAAGWHLIPIYVGLQAPGNSCGCAAISAASASSEGAAAAGDAVTHAEAIGLGAGNPIYYDMEGYSPGSSTSAAVMTFLGAWTQQLHANGYESGVYSSDDSGIRDLVAKGGTGYDEPDDLWVANWNGQQNTADANVPSGDWPAHQRVHQYRGGHNDDYGGATINIDSDYVDAATASAGSSSTTTTIAAAPSLGVAPQADGTIQLYPRWSGEAGISSWQILAGNSPSALQPWIKVRAGARLPVVSKSAFSYFQVIAQGPASQTLGTSGPVATPGHVAIFGNSSFVPRHGSGGLPVGCFNAAACELTTTITAGKKRLVATKPERIAGGGVAYFALSSAWHKAVATARKHRLPVTITVRNASTGARATRSLNLVPFAQSGRAPRHSIRSSAALRIVGATDFVSNGWSGGALAWCVASSPCSTTTTITAGGGKTIAHTRPESLGAGQVGYLPFALNRTGHNLLRAAKTNQLGARLKVTTARSATGAGTTATAQITIASFS